MIETFFAPAGAIVLLVLDIKSERTLTTPLSGRR
jgi:hypothetical protein